MQSNRILVDLDDSQALQFHTLSYYTWGSVRAYQTYSRPWQAFDIRQDFLDFLSIVIVDSMTLQELIWINQICIDQNSTQERNHQVELMGKVYRQASQI
jgi:Heterokaryon incompatibility protein (HET)